MNKEERSVLPYASHVISMFHADSIINILPKYELDIISSFTFIYLKEKKHNPFHSIDTSKHVVNERNGNFHFYIFLSLSL